MHNYSTENIRIQLKTFQACAFVPESYVYPYFVIALAALYDLIHANDEINGSLCNSFIWLMIFA